MSQNNTAPTAPVGSNDTQIANTAFVTRAVSGGPGGAVPEAPNTGLTYGRQSMTWVQVLPLAGGTMTGNLILNGVPTTTLQAATKGYVDSSISTAITGIPVFGPSGPTHSTGVVPDPGSTTGSARFLCENATWVVPTGSGPGGATVTIADTAPGAPTQGSLWWQSSSGQFYISYTDVNSTQWVSINGLGTGAGGASVTIADTAPTAPTNGALWWQSSTGTFWISYNDGSSVQWVGVGGNGSLANVAPPQVTVITSGSGSYSPPPGTSWLEVELVGGGGGGTTGGGAGGNGQATTFGPLTGGGGGGSPNTGGTATGGQINIPGASGNSGVYSTASAANGVGGIGGSSYFGGAGSGIYGAAGGNAVANSGSGGGSGTANTTGTAAPGIGGGAGGYVRSVITSPAASYSYSVGLGGAGGVAGSVYTASGNGAAGIIIIKAFAAAPSSGATATPGTIVNTAYAELTTVATTSAVMAGVLDSIPQQTDGSQLMQVTITPQAATHRLRIHFSTCVASSAAANYVWFAVFQDNTAAALASANHQFAQLNYPETVVLDVDVVAGTASATTLKIRWGNNQGASGTFTVNGSAGARFLGGSLRAVLDVLEIAA